MQKPLRVCKGMGSAFEALSILRLRLHTSQPLKANGRCLLRYHVQGKQDKQSVPVKLWVNPPSEVYLQGTLALDPQGIVLGSNERVFWLAIKPGGVSSYWWGQWSEASCPDKLMFSPRTLIEALGLAAIDISEIDNWSLSNEGVFDVLTKRDSSSITKKIYIYSCDYSVRRIEYFNASGETSIVAEMGKYKAVAGGFSVPTFIKIISYDETGKGDSVEITLGSIKLTSFSDKQKKRLFTRPEGRGFKHIYKFGDNCELIEQPE